VVQAGNPLRLNPEAERLSAEARKLKQSGRYDQAAYTKCLELDRFNHYCFIVAETFMLAFDVYNGSIEAKCSLHDPS
jgi:hypothetical protein